MRESWNWFKGHVSKFWYLWGHITAFDCRMNLIGEFMFSPDDLNRRYEEELYFQNNLKNAFKR